MKRSFITCHSLVVMAVAAVVGMMGTAPVNAAVSSDVEITTTVPAAPVILPARAGNGEATANWAAPVFDGGSPVSAYHVQMVDAATGKRAIAVKDVAATATSVSVTGLAKGTAVRFQVQAINAVGASALSPFSNAVTVRAAAVPGYHTGTQTIGRSVQGRAITLTVVGSPTAKKRVMVIGEIHGNERGGVPIANAIATSPARAGVAYFVVSYPNPDGAARNTRGNARGVDLNRNFPGWKRNGGPGNVYYPGPRALSEKESAVMYAAIQKIKPTAFVTYHQHMNVIDFGGGNKGAQATYARQTGMKFVTLSRYPGSQATWLHSAYPNTLVMTVELPGSVRGAIVNKHIAALKYLATHH